MYKSNNVFFPNSGCTAGYQKTSYPLPLCKEFLSEADGELSRDEPQRLGITFNRYSTPKDRRHRCPLEPRNQANNTRINAQHRGRRRTQCEENIESIEMPVAHKASRPPLLATIFSHKCSSNSIKGFRGEDCTSLDLEAEHEDWWEGVGELQDTHCADKTGDVAELGNGGAEDERHRPIDRHQAYPQPFALFGGKGWSIQQLLQDLDPDVAVQASSDEAREQEDDIRRRLPVIWTQALHSGVKGILALKTVGYHAEGDIAGVEVVCAQISPFQKSVALRISDMDSQNIIEPP